MDRTIQEGIYYQRGARPGKFFAILFLEASHDTDATAVSQTLADLWQIYTNLKAGGVADLPAHPVPSGDLTVLIGYGADAFRLSGSKNMPHELRAENRFLLPRTRGGGPILINSGLSYAHDVNRNVAYEPFAIQFIADTQLAVDRAIVETWKYLFDLEHTERRLAPLMFASFFTGFQRDDGRSWIDFHDGLSNLRSGPEREAALRIKTGEYERGTYLCFLRLAVDMAAWRKLSRHEQQIMVGRDKLTGCAFDRLNADGIPMPIAGCPVVGTSEVFSSDPGNRIFREPPLVGDPVLRQSHVQRANLHHNGSVNDPGSLRIFRQGYEFLEPANDAPGFRAGLNFVSFQDTPDRVLNMLTRRGWLGGTNFGGDPDNPLPGMNELLTVRAGGLFLVPPVIEGEAFPGQGILGQ
ncbi:MAG: peroxidase [Chloroflexota bacterium]